jgi:hypothetical protein
LGAMPKVFSGRAHGASCEARTRRDEPLTGQGVPVGGGERHKSDVAKGPPVNGLGELGGGGPAEVDACAAPRTVDFLMTGASQVGALVTVLAGAPPLVFAGTGQIGVLVEQAAEGVQACLDRGYEMTGVIDAVDATSGTGRLQISGQLG